MNELQKTGRFKEFSKSADEEEHSLEMQYPFLKLVLPGDTKIVPITVGSVNDKLDVEHADILQKYYNDKDNLFVFSTDFCHWGKRFGYTPYNKQDGDICDSIQKLDEQGMKLLEKQDSE